MKWIVALSIIAVVVPGTAAGKERNPNMSKADESEVIRLENEFMAAWNRGDAHGAAALFDPEGVRVSAFGEVAHGRTEIEAAYQKLLGGAMKGAKGKVETQVRFLSADIALVQGPLTIQPPDGAPPIRGYAVDIWRRQAGHWSLLEAHPKLFPARPGK